MACNTTKKQRREVLIQSISLQFNLCIMTAPFFHLDTLTDTAQAIQPTGSQSIDYILFIVYIAIIAYTLYWITHLRQPKQ